MKLNDFDWLKSEVGPFIPLDFMTHLNYVSCMKDLSEGLAIELKFNIDSKSSFLRNSLSKKISLIKLIKESLDEEHKKALEEKDFAKVCSMWISVKSYYLIFNLLLVLCALVNNDKENLDYAHSKVISNFRTMIKNKKLVFNKEYFNLVVFCSDALCFKSKSGDTLRADVDNKLRVNSVLKKLCKYKFEDFCRYKNIKNFRKKINKKIRQDFFNNNEISLFEFFYWYRIKTNYRDLAFLDQEINKEYVAKFYENYYLLTINFYDALKILINEVSKKRLGELIIND